MKPEPTLQRTGRGWSKSRVHSALWARSCEQRDKRDRWKRGRALARSSAGAKIQPRASLASTTWTARKMAEDRSMPDRDFDRKKSFSALDNRRGHRSQKPNLRLGMNHELGTKPGRGPANENSKNWQRTKTKSDARISAWMATDWEPTPRPSAQTEATQHTT
jgi:hypothetical protein